MPVRPEYILATNEESPFYAARRSMAQVLSAMGGDAFQTQQLPAGWLRRRWGGWEGWTPRDWTPRLQGWKIHISTTPACAAETLARTTRICVARQVAFKFLPEPCNLLDSNGKQQNRGASGKFVTIYPDDDTQFAELLAELDEALAGQQGPYILSDLRYGEGPVYVRYGGIMPLTFADGKDRPVSAIAAVDTLGLQADRREPRFIVPDGVEMPACLIESYQRSQQSVPTRLREFKAVAPLHFSNAGGVYRATLPDGTRHVLREARSNTGLDGRGRDAVERQLQEEEVLRDLVGVPGVQQLLGSFWAWEHRYLELEHIEGRTLTSWVVQNTPFDGKADDRAAYARRAVGVARQVIAVVERIHDKGWCIGDLHPGNIMVGDDDTVTMLDFEDATRITAEREIGFRVYEFCAPPSLDAAEADWYAVSRSLMLMFVADWEVEVVAPGFWGQAIGRVRDWFGAEAAEVIDDVLQRFPTVDKHMLAPNESVDVWDAPPPAEGIVNSLDDGIAWSRQWSPTGAFPGDGAQPGDPSETLAFGRAGVLFARNHCGREVSDHDLDALASAARGQAEPGLMDGRAGMALSLAECGRHEDAVRAVREALEESEGRKRLDLFGGRAGVVLAALEVARIAGDDELLADALVANERLQQSLGLVESVHAELTHRRGLHFGLSGLALVDLTAHLASGRPDLLERAAGLVRAELDACFLTADGDLMVRDVDNSRALPYVEWGSAGIWAVAQLAERLLGRPLLTADEYDGVVRACSSEVYIYTGLDHGRAGIMAVLAGLGDRHHDLVAHQRDLVLANLLRHDDQAVVVGDGLVRLSADLSTGAAGVMLAMHCVESDNPFGWLPLAARTSRFVAGLAAPRRPVATPPHATEQTAQELFPAGGIAATIAG